MSGDLIRLLDKTDTSGVCWTFTGASTHDGYGRFWHRGRMGYAHVAAYEMFKGSLPEGMEVDHLCGTRNCVKPSHLDAVTRGENMRRRWHGSTGGRVWDRASRACVLSDYESGRTVAELADEIGLSPRRVYHLLSEARSERVEAKS